MTTSLAEQLQRLSVPQTTNLLRDKKRPSLLFNPKEAAGIKKETAFEIGLEGFQELLQKNPSFDQFSNTLFHVTSKDFERSVHDAESNEKLNKHIKKFLLMLSPYFLLNCSYKAMEWLIYRYQIQDYNKEDILMLVLPFHESNIFVRVIQLLKFKDVNDSWYFLKALQKPGVHLPKQTLLNHAASDVYFIKFVGDYIKDIVKVHENPSILTVSFNFYCSIFTGAIEYSNEVEEKLVVQMLPTILKGLNSEIADFCAASYVIVARLVAKTTLSNDVLDNIVVKIANSKVPSLKSEAMLLYLVIYQSQRDYKQIHEDALNAIVEQKWFGKTLQQLNGSGCYIYPFLEVLLKHVVLKGCKVGEGTYTLFLNNLLEELKIDQEYVGACIKAVLDGVKTKVKKDQTAKTWLADILNIFDKQYPSQFDKIIYDIIIKKSETQEDTARKSKLQSLINNTLKFKNKFELFDKLYHSNAVIRQNAIKFIATNFGELEGNEMLQESLEDRLKDEDVNVVAETLAVIKSTNLIDENISKNSLINILNKYYQKPLYWKPILPDIIKLLCSSKYADDLAILLNIFPLLLPKDNSDINYTKIILNSKYISNNSIFKNIAVLKDIKEADVITEKIVDNIKENEKIALNLLKQLTDDAINEMSYLNMYVTCLILSRLIPQNLSVEKSLPFVEVFSKMHEKAAVKSKKISENILDNFQICKKRFPLFGFLESFVMLLSKIDQHKIDTLYLDFTNDYPIHKIIMFAAEIIYHSNVNKKFVTAFNKLFFKSEFEEINFMLRLAIYKKNEAISRDVLQIFKEFYNVKDFNERLTIINLLILMQNPLEEIRALSIEISEELIKSNKNSASSRTLKTIIEQKQEIILDKSQLCVVISNASQKNEDVSEFIKEIFNAYLYPSYIFEGIFNFLSLVNDDKTFEETSYVALRILNENNVLNEIQGNIIVNNICRFKPEISPKILVNSNILKFLLNVVKQDNKFLITEDRKISISACLMQEIDSEFVNNLDDYIKLLFLDAIIEISTVSTNPEILPGSNKIFKHISLDAEQILPHFEIMRDKKIRASTRRSLNIPSLDILETLQWRKGVRTLELVQNKKKLYDCHKLLPVLFDLLKKCLSFEEQAPVEYSKQLILSLILHCCEKLGNKKVSENIFNMELVVQCIRASPNPQTHHHALLVLARCSKLIPTQVLHHIMAIFTFMGSSVLRYDNAYSFQLIINIIDSVIPILVEDNDNYAKTILSVLTVFVDVILDVPEHRRLPLYHQLLLRLNAKENMSTFLILLFQAHVLHSEKEKKIKNKYEDFSKKRLDIAVSLAVEFEPQVIFTSVVNLLQYLKTLPIEKDDNAKIRFIDLSLLTPKQFRHFKYSIIMYLNNLLSSPILTNKIALLDDKTLESLEPFYKDMIINALTYLQKTTQVVDNYAHTPQEQYWQIVLKNSYDILDHINALLTAEMFLLVIKGLMSHNLSNVRKRSLELLNFKLQNGNAFFDLIEKQDLYALINPLVKIIENVDNPDLDHEEEQVIQTALYSLKLLVKVLANENPEKFVTVLEFITNILRTRRKQDNVLASIMLCVAELCVNLKVHSINCLPHFMPALLKILRKFKKADSPGLLLLALLTVLQKILEILPLFLSPYLVNIIVNISLISSAYEENSDEKNLPCIEKLVIIRKNIGKYIAPRVLIPVIEESYNNLVEKEHFDAISPLMKILLENISNLQGQEISGNLAELTKFFLNALQFRDTQECSLSQKNIVENQIIEAFSSLTLKLSETSFRPLYYKLFDWAVRSERKDDRIITFYNLSKGVAKHLKSLFVLFAGHIVNNAAQILDACNKTKNSELYYEDDEKNILLVENILETFHDIFKYDTIKFLNKERFEVLMQPIADQLENDLGGLDALEKRNVEILTPCIVQFAVATADDSLWKQINYQILLKMRNSESKIRLIALKCLTEVVKQLGEDFLPLLPETIPFLAELLEDEDEEVEISCKKSVQVMEQVLGEPLQKYF